MSEKKKAWKEASVWEKKEFLDEQVDTDNGPGCVIFILLFLFLSIGWPMFIIIIAH